MFWIFSMSAVEFALHNYTENQNLIVRRSQSRTSSDVAYLTFSYLSSCSDLFVFQIETEQCPNLMNLSRGLNLPKTGCNWARLKFKPRLKFFKFGLSTYISPLPTSSYWHPVFEQNIKYWSEAVKKKQYIKRKIVLEKENK